MILSGGGQKPVTGRLKFSGTINCKEIWLAEQLFASQKTLQSVHFVTSLQGNLVKDFQYYWIFVTPIMPKSNSDTWSA